MQRGYKVELDPNNKQLTMLKKHAGVARFTYNWGLDICKQSIQNKEKIPSAMDLHKQIVLLKQEKPWLREVSKCAPQEALRNLETAFKNFYRNCKNKSKSKGFPIFKSKKKNKESFRLTGTIKLLDNYVQLPRLGKIKLKEIDYLPKNSNILSATISEQAGHWFVSILVEQIAPIKVNKSEKIIGLDLGIKSLAVCSDGRIFENHRAMRNSLDKLKKLGRRVSKKQKGSQNREKARKQLARQHYRMACIRKDTLHKISSELTKTNSVIVIENLNIAGMLQNHKLARAIQDMGWYELRRQLEYKSDWYSCKIVIADRFYPSSQICSFCGVRKTDLNLNDREYICGECGNKIDRDLNAAKNLEKLYTVSSTEINTYGEESSGLVGKQSETIFDEIGIKQEI